MKACNVDIFDRRMNYVWHEIASNPAIDDDYLAPSTTSIVVSRHPNAPKDGFIHIVGDFSFFGCITDAVTDEYTTTISFLPFISVFDQQILFDTDWQGSSRSLENALSTIISNNWIHNTDALQNMPLVVQIPDTEHDTDNWGFNLKPDTEGMHHSIINFVNVLVRRSLTKYGVSMTATPDPNNHRIIINIGKVDGEHHIDADLPNVEVDTFKVNEAGKVTNKLVVWNTTNYTQKIEYYLHPDGSYDTTNDDRITPVVMSVNGAAPYDNKPFPVAADESASSTFDGIEWSNQITLVVQNDDSIINPSGMIIGQQVKVIRNGIEYTTMLTGKTLGEETTLIFGTIRLELTKKLKME
jgi:hypothetical protein